MTTVVDILCTYLLMAVLAIVYRFYLRFSSLYMFWKERRVPGPLPQFPFGTEFGNTMSKSKVEHLDWLYYKQGGKKYCGYIDLHRPVFFTGQTKLIKEILVKSFEHFHDRPLIIDSNNTGRMVTELRGEEWRSLRSRLSPMFTGYRLRSIQGLMIQSAQSLRDYIMEIGSGGEIDVMQPFGLYSIETSASCLLGVKLSAFDNSNSSIVNGIVNIFNVGLKDFIMVYLRKHLPKTIASLILPPSRDSFIRAIVTDIIRQRRSGVIRHDLPQMMLDAKDEDGNSAIDDETIIQQCVMFLLSGYESVRSLLSFSAYCLATNPHCQDLALQEVDEVVRRHRGRLTADALLQLSYLDIFICEVARLYPSAVLIERLVTSDFQITDSDIVIPRNTVVQVPIFSLQRDPDHFPDPLSFDPNRFLPEMKSQHNPFTYLPFGRGPRQCVGKKFVLMQTKSALATLLQAISFQPGPSTPAPPVELMAILFSGLVPIGNKLMLSISHRPGK